MPPPFSRAYLSSSHSETLEPRPRSPYAPSVLRTVPLLLALTALAPFQCSKSYDPTLRRDDDPGDALYDLAQDFKAKGDDKSYRETLQFLVKRYPSSRRAVKAREDLGADAGVTP
jgi:hypothetical protein